MSARREPGVDLVLLWHHHQPDYRDPAGGRALLPWVRLHATKDYLDMALRLERFPGVWCTFNFVPSLLDQLAAAASGGPDALFDALRLGVSELTPETRAEVSRRCAAMPPHALERWPAARALAVKAGGAALSDGELIALETFFLLAWLDPMWFGEAEAARALAAAPRFDRGHRDGLLALHDRLVGRVVDAYRVLAERGQVELSASPYDHPILPLLIDVRSARRARPQLPLPSEPFAHPEDAERQIVRARKRHAEVFGAEPAGMWPSEGSVSPEAVTIAARLGVRWMASDEGVLWGSLESDARRREAAYRPWRFATDAGDVALFFRDHELSDRIGFVYSHWNHDEAAADFVARLRRIGDETPGPERPVVTVALDGENCWEHYPEDGGPFLDALYARLASDDQVRTRTPSQVVADGVELPALDGLHSGSWIDADFHIWIGHPEKNRGWDLLARTRRALAESGSTPVLHPTAWQSLGAAEGSDWFWWMGEDHYTSDKSLFDHLFRSHLRAAHERAGLPVPAWLDVPLAPPRRAGIAETTPIGFLKPDIDGESTHYYEWHNAGRFRLANGGGSMHRDGGRIAELQFGCDMRLLFVRIDFARDSNGAKAAPPGADWAIELELLVPRPRRLRVAGLVPGSREVQVLGPDGAAVPATGARCAIGRVLELEVPFAVLGVEAGEDIELVTRLLHGGQVQETAPADDLIRLRVPDERAVLASWSA